MRPGPPPATRRQDAVDVYHGVKVVDPYRWLEAASEERDRWFAAQNQYARRVLRALPGRDRLRNQLREGNREVERLQVLRAVGGGRQIFALRRGASDESSRLVVRSGWDGAERVLVDPGRRGDGLHRTIDSAHPSPDGRYVAYVMSSAGSELGAIEIVEVESGRVLPDRIERAQQPALISWRPDARSFFYWRRPASRPGTSPSDWLKDIATYLHVIGDDPDASRPVIGAGMRDLGIDSHAVTYVDARPGSRWAVAVALQDISRRSFFAAPLARVKPGATRWRRVIGADEKVTAVIAHQDRLYALTYADAPNYRIISFDADKETMADASEFVAASDLVLVDFVAARDAMYVVSLDRGIHRLFRVAWDSGARTEIALPFEGAIGDLVPAADEPGLVFSMEGWIRRPAWFQVEGGTVVRELPLTVARPGAQRFLAERAVATGRDGVEVPLSIIRREEAALDGTAPAMLHGYGAYGLSMTPMYNPFYLTWVKWGGVYATCHVRGGGERGKSWHLSGIREKKENGVDDFIACAEFLIKKGYSAPSRLTAITASAGGLVVGGAITKRPELFAVAVIRVGDLNPMRKEVTEGGPGHIEEYGDVSDKEQFATVYATDPYHRIRQGVDYPAVLLTAGLRDFRVNAWVPGKFAARLQATGSERPIFLRIETDDGHGFASTQSQREEEYADIFAFALWQSRESARP